MATLEQSSINQQVSFGFANPGIAERRDASHYIPRHVFAVASASQSAGSSGGAGPSSRLGAGAQNQLPMYLGEQEDQRAE